MGTQTDLATRFKERGLKSDDEVKSYLDAMKVEMDSMSDADKLRMGVSGLRSILNTDVAGIHIKEIDYPVIILFKNEDFVQRLNAVSKSGKMERLTGIVSSMEWSDACFKIWEDASHEEKVLSAVNFIGKHVNSVVPIMVDDKIPYECVVVVKDPLLFDLMMTPAMKEA
jgi:hypothetical protein